MSHKYAMCYVPPVLSWFKQLPWTSSISNINIHKQATLLELSEPTLTFTTGHLPGPISGRHPAWSHELRRWGSHLEEDLENLMFSGFPSFQMNQRVDLTFYRRTVGLKVKISKWLRVELENWGTINRLNFTSVYAFNSFYTSEYN